MDLGGIYLQYSAGASAQLCGDPQGLNEGVWVGGIKSRANIKLIHFVVQ